MMRHDDSPEGDKDPLSDLSPEDRKTLKMALPILRNILGFAVVTKWLIITLLGVLTGVVLFGESVMKIIRWFQG